MDAEFSFKSKLNIKEYADGYRIFDLKRGRSAGREWKSTVFFMISMAMLFFLLMSVMDIGRMPVCAAVFLISAYMCTHYVYILPRKAKLRGEHIYKSSKMLSKEYVFDVYPDYFIMRNKNESIKRYYSDVSDCIETKNIIVIIGGFEKRFIVISKRNIEKNELEKISRYFKNRMVKQYRRIKDPGSKE